MGRSTGIRTRHSRACKSVNGGRCNCDPTYEAFVYSPRDGKKIRQSFPTEAAAKGWRIDAAKLVRDKKLRAPEPTTLTQEVESWLAGTKAGEILNKREQRYKPSVLRSYESALRLRVLPELGNRRLSDVTLADLLELKEDLQGKGVAPGTVRNTFVPLQAIFRRARLSGRIAVDPTTDLPLPTSGTRDRAADPEQADELLAVLPDPEQALWATGFYAGLRKGELQALRVRSVDLEAQTIDVEHGWDAVEGEIAVKSKAGARRVFVLDVLKPYLEPLIEDRGPEEFVFGGLSPFDARAVDRKADRALTKVNKNRAEEELLPVLRFTLHEARHSFSTWLADSGVVDYHCDRYLGHSGGHVRDRYRHLRPEVIAEDRELLDAYLAGRASGKVVPLAAAS